MEKTDNNPRRKKFVSIVVPALNEEITIGEFIDWCKQGLLDAGAEGEILIIDSSTDKTPEIAEAHGARIVKVPKRGLGHAYIDAMPHIRGDYIIMGDCDLTYDFRELKGFIEKLDNGYDFVMGTRMKGTIEPGAMPSLHRYFGTPLTTFILNRMYGSRFSDIHCGMRAMTLDALKKLDIESTSWEYASEMVLKAVKLGLKTTEIPIKFYKDRAGRLSHMKRGGWFSPWYAGWINLKVMFLYNPDYFLMKSGFSVMLLGLIMVVALLLRHSIKIGNITLAGHGMFLGVTLTVIGYSAVQMAILSRIFYDFIPSRNLTYKKIFMYNNGIIAGSILMAGGILLLLNFIGMYIKSDFTLQNISNPAIVGLLLFILGFQTFTFTLMFQMVVNRQRSNKRKLSGMVNLQ
jgi:glycosyltransferase involved in cell wall biosynthesis